MWSIQKIWGWNTLIEVKSITTKFGTASLDGGYWRIYTAKEGNRGKRLHRLIYEDFHKCTLLPNAFIHHKDGNRSNNRIDNLELISPSEHSTLHQTGNTYCLGRKLSDGTKKKIGDAHRGEKNHMWNKHHSMGHMRRVSRTMGSTGFFRLSKDKNKECAQGFAWNYQYYTEEGEHKKIRSVSLIKVKQKVLDKGLDWKVINEENALLTCEKYGYDLRELI